MLVAAVFGAVFGLLHSVLTVTLGLSQHVSGLGVTLFASSFSYYVFRLLVPVAVPPPPTIEPFQPIAIAGLSDLPFLGPPSSPRRRDLSCHPACCHSRLFIFRTPLGACDPHDRGEPACCRSPGQSIRWRSAMGP